MSPEERDGSTLSRAATSAWLPGHRRAYATVFNRSVGLSPGPAPRAALAPLFCLDNRLSHVEMARTVKEGRTLQA